MKNINQYILERLILNKIGDDTLEDIINSNKILQIISSIGNINTDDGGYFSEDTFEFPSDIDDIIDELYDNDPDFDEFKYKKELAETECKKVLREINNWIETHNIKDVDIIFDQEMSEYDDDEVNMLYDKANEFDKTVKIVKQIKPTGKGKELFNVNIYTNIYLYPSGVLVEAGYVGSRFFKGIK